MMTAPAVRSLPTSELEWLRGFAARLTGSEADDLVQEVVPESPVLRGEPEVVTAQEEALRRA